MSCYKDIIKNHQDFRWYPLPLFWKFFEKLLTHCTPRCKSTTVSQNDKYGKLQKMDWNRIWHVSFLGVQIFSQSHLLYVPSNCQQFVGIPVQTALDVPLGFRTQWIVYICSYLRRIWFLLNLCHFFRFVKCFNILIVLTTWMDPKTQAD